MWRRFQSVRRRQLCQGSGFSTAQSVWLRLNSQDGTLQLISTTLIANPGHLQNYFWQVEKTLAVPQEGSRAMAARWPAQNHWRKPQKIIACAVHVHKQMVNLAARKTGSCHRTHHRAPAAWTNYSCLRCKHVGSESRSGFTNSAKWHDCDNADPHPSSSESIAKKNELLLKRSPTGQLSASVLLLRLLSSVPTSSFMFCFQQ